MEKNMGNMECANPLSIVDAGISKSVGMMEGAQAEGRYMARCYDADGNLKWEDEIENLVVTAGKNDALDKYFAGSAYTAAWYMGLVDGASSPTYNAADVMSSHAGWTESTAYSNSARPTAAFSAASGGSKSLSAALSFNINGNATIAGCFMVTNSTKGGTTGVLYSAGSFTGGNKSVANGDTLNVSYTASL